MNDLNLITCIVQRGRAEKVVDAALKAGAPGVTLTPLKTISGDRQVEIRFDNVAVSPENILGGINLGWGDSG